MPAIVLLFGLILAFALDQATKAVALARLPKQGSIRYGHLLFSQVQNVRPSLAFPISYRVFIGLWATELGLMLVLVQSAPISELVLVQLALGAALGGATSNLFDQLYRGNIVDFINLRFWPRFNFADAAIVAGVLIALYWWWKYSF
jgi:signal peptidase II